MSSSVDNDKLVPKTRERTGLPRHEEQKLRVVGGLSLFFERAPPQSHTRPLLDPAGVAYFVEFDYPRPTSETIATLRGKTLEWFIIGTPSCKKPFGKVFLLEIPGPVHNCFQRTRVPPSLFL